MAVEKRHMQNETGATWVQFPTARQRDTRPACWICGEPTSGVTRVWWEMTGPLASGEAKLLPVHIDCLTSQESAARHAQGA